jgi:hypothetical protein
VAARIAAVWENLSTRLTGELVILEPLAPEHFDAAIYSILDSEWPDVRANLERRVQAHAGREG